MKIDQTTFTSLGINLPADQMTSFERYFMETLEERIGYAISELLDDDQLTELVSLQETGNDQVVADWIKANVPDYAEIAQDEFDILMGEVAENAETINA